VVFVSRRIGKRNLASHIEALSELAAKRSCRLRHIVLLGQEQERGEEQPCVEAYPAFLRRARSIFGSEDQLRRAEAGVQATDILNLQFTSGMCVRTHAAAYPCSGADPSNNNRHDGQPQSGDAHTYVSVSL